MQLSRTFFTFLGTPKHPDVILTGDGISLLFYSGRKITPNTPTKFQVPLEPYYWVLPSGSGIDRSKLMVVLNNLDGIYIRANYALDPNGQARFVCYIFLALSARIETQENRGIHLLKYSWENSVFG